MQRRMRKMESLGYPPLVVSSYTIKQIGLPGWAFSGEDI